MVEGVRKAFDRCNGAWWLSIDEATAKRLEEDGRLSNTMPGYSDGEAV